jgi:Xaa-Pro aminopeptidase
MTTRRDVMKGALAGTLATVGAPALAADRDRAPRVPDLSFLRENTLMNKDRARYFMEREGLDALVVSHPANVFYLSNHWPQLDRMGFQDSAMAIFSRDPKRPLAVLMHAFLYYYTHSPESAFYDRLVFPYTQPADPNADPGDGEPAAAPARTRTERGIVPISERNQRRKDMLSKTEPVAPDVSWALARALRELGLTRGVIGIDNPRIAEVAAKRGLPATFRPGENTIRRIRLAKTPTEIRLMRMAAQQNVDAAVVTANMARELGSAGALRARFFAEAELRGNRGVFMVVNGTSAEVIDEPLVDGMAFSIDCVSHCRHYHGDFARTIFVGEPHANMIKVTNGIATAWSEIREQLRPGMRFADIPPIGKASLKKQGLALNVSFTPHAVGLFHTDHPSPSLLDGRTIEGLVLEENMILSVDCPPIDAGIGGTAHLEDLMLIKKDGAQPIHDVPPGVFIV